MPCRMHGAAPPDPDDGCRVRVDRLWRRGISKPQAMAEKNDVTLLFAAKDETHNNAVVVREWLSRNLSEDLISTRRLLPACP